MEIMYILHRCDQCNPVAIELLLILAEYDVYKVLCNYITYQQKCFVEYV